MVSTLTITGAVSATKDSNTAIRQYDIFRAETNEVIGKLTVNLATGHYVMDVNYGKADVTGIKDAYKDRARADPPTHDINHVILYDEVWGISFYDMGVLNKGGNVHGEGYLTDKETNMLWPDTMTFFKDWTDNARFSPRYFVL